MDDISIQTCFEDLIDSVRRAVLRQIIRDATEDLYQFKNHSFDCMEFKMEFGIYGCAYKEHINEIQHNASRTCDF